MGLEADGGLFSSLHVIFYASSVVTRLHPEASPNPHHEMAGNSLLQLCAGKDWRSGLGLGLLVEYYGLLGMCGTVVLIFPRKRGCRFKPENTVS
jgi:hypothetical protein